MGKSKASVPPSGMKPLFGSSTTAVPTGDLVFIEPRPYCTWSAKAVLWKGHNSALVKAKYADPRLLTKDYTKGLSENVERFADSDVDMLILRTLRIKAKFTKRFTFPAVHIEDNGRRTDITLAAYASEKGDQVMYLDTGFGGTPDVMYAGPNDPKHGCPTAAVNQPTPNAVTLVVACYRYDDELEMGLHVVKTPKLAKLLGVLRAIREAVGADFRQASLIDFNKEAEANEALRKALEACDPYPQLEKARRSLLKAAPTEWLPLLRPIFNPS